MPKKAPILTLATVDGRRVDAEVLPPRGDMKSTALILIASLAIRTAANDPYNIRQALPEVRTARDLLNRWLERHEAAQ